MGAPCVLASERPSHPDDERGSTKPSYNQSVIYCVIPPELADELYDKLVDYYKDNPNVEVIIDRRTGPDRRTDRPPKMGEKRETRDRRRPRAPGTFLPADAPEGES